MFWRRRHPRFLCNLKKSNARGISFDHWLFCVPCPNIVRQNELAGIMTNDSKQDEWNVIAFWLRIWVRENHESMKNHIFLHYVGVNQKNTIYIHLQSLIMSKFIFFIIYYSEFYLKVWFRLFKWFLPTCKCFTRGGSEPGVISEIAFPAMAKCWSIGLYWNKRARNRGINCTIFLFFLL